MNEELMLKGIARLRELNEEDFRAMLSKYTKQFQGELMSESQTIVKELLQAKEEANNLLHNTVIKVIQCNFPYTLDDVTLTLYEMGYGWNISVWVVENLF